MTLDLQLKIKSQIKDDFDLDVKQVNIKIDSVEEKENEKKESKKIVEKNDTINKYKKYLLKKYETLSKKDIKIGYGGSINSNNIIGLKNIDILLIGSSCLDINEFINIINNV